MNTPVEVAIAFEDVSKSFGSEKVLDQLTFDVRQGTAFGILGRSGTGKSVILKHMIGLMKPDQGKIYIEGQNIVEINRQGLAQVRQRIGFLFQNSALFDSISVAENVAFPLRRHKKWEEGRIRHQVDQCLAQVGLEKDGEKMPASLSGGMKKRAGLARALSMEPDILLVDEPSSGLDPLTSEEIDKLLTRLRTDQNVTLVFVTHNIVSARNIGDELMVLEEGRIAAQGSPDDLEKSDHPIVRKFMQFEGVGN